MKSNSELCAVIIPFYEKRLSKKQLKIIEHNTNMLKKWSIYFVVPHSNKVYAKNLSSTALNIKVKSFDG